MIVRVLLVEDDIDIAKLMTKMLVNYADFTEFDVTHVETIKRAKSKLKDNFYDCILLDLLLPNSRGLETFKEIKKACPKCPVVIVSGFEEDGSEGVKLGAQDYIPKTGMTYQVLERSIKYAIERNKLEEEKINAELQFNNVITNTPLGVHMYELQDDDLYFCGYNLAADNILNLDHSSRIGMKIEDAFPNIKDIKDEYIYVIKTGESWIDRRIEYTDGHVNGIFSICAFRIGKNKMSTTFQDISERVEAERNLKRSKERFKLLSEATFEGVAITEHGKIIDVNDQFCKMLGAKADDVVGRDVIEFVAPQDKDKVLKNLLKKREKPYEHMARKKDGSYFPVEIHGRTLSENLRLTAVRDMTRYKEAEKKEKIIFKELDERIQQWRNEMTEENRIRKDTIKEVVNKIKNMTNKIGVF